MIRDHIVMNCVSIDLWSHTTTAGKRPLSQIISRYLVKNRALKKTSNKNWKMENFKPTDD